MTFIQDQEKSVASEICDFEKLHFPQEVMKLVDSLLVVPFLFFM